MSAAFAEAAAPSTVTAAATVRPAPFGLRDNNDIPALQLYVLFEVLAGAHLAVVEIHRLLTTRRVADDDNAVQLRVGVTTAGDAERLEDVQGRVHDDGAGLRHLADHIGHVTFGL